MSQEYKQADVVVVEADTLELVASYLALFAAGAKVSLLSYFGARIRPKH